MILHYLCKNIAEDIKNTRIIVTILLSTAVCIFTMLFSYGIIRDYEISKNEMSDNGFSVNLNEKESFDDVMVALEKAYSLYFRKAENAWIIPMFDHETSDPLYISCNFTVENGRLNPYYLRRKVEFTDGRNFTSDEYASSNKIAILNDSVEKNEIMINGKVYKVIGHMKTPGNVIENEDIGYTAYIPPASIKDEKLVAFGISLKLVSSKKEKEMLEEILCNSLENGFSLNFYEKDDGIMGTSSKAGFAVGAILGLISAINILMVFQFLLKKREHSLFCLRLCGAKKKEIRYIFLLEVMFFTVGTAVLISLLFSFVEKKYLQKYYLYFPDIYKQEVYIILLMIYFVVSMVMCSLMLWSKVDKIRSRTDD